MANGNSDLGSPSQDLANVEASQYQNPSWPDRDKSTRRLACLSRPPARLPISRPVAERLTWECGTAAWPCIRLCGKSRSCFVRAQQSPGANKRILPLGIGSPPTRTVARWDVSQLAWQFCAYWQLLISIRISFTIVHNAEYANRGRRAIMSVVSYFPELVSIRNATYQLQELSDFKVAF